jgi:DNA-binding MarR family transcriptional regulator
MEQLTMDFRKQNSREAYDSTKPKLGAIQGQIMYALRKMGKGTFYQIAEASGLDPSQVWKRCSELERKRAIRPCGKAMGNGGRNVTVWEVV